MTRDDEPWFLVEVKSSSNARLSPNLVRFQEATGAANVFDLDFVDRDCFESSTPVIVPARTMLSQLC